MTDSKLQAMHNLACDLIISGLMDGDPKMIPHALAMIKQHKVEIVPVPGSGLDKVAKAIPATMPFPRQA